MPRIQPRRAPETPRGLPLAAKAVLALAIVALGAVVLFTLNGALPRIVSAVGDTVSGITGAVLPSPSTPSPSPVAVPVSPVLDKPSQVSTNQATVTITGSVPASLVGPRAGVTIRLYVAYPQKQPVLVREVPLGETPSFSIPDVTLQPGHNDFSATVVGPGGASEASPIVTYVLDTTPPKITISAPVDKSTVNADSVTIVGKTQGRSSVTARDAANGRTAIGVADGTGAFQVVMQLVDGTNAISLTATDPAGNADRADGPAGNRCAQGRAERLFLPDQRGQASADAGAARRRHESRGQQPAGPRHHVHRLDSRRAADHRAGDDRRDGAGDLPDADPGRCHARERARDGVPDDSGFR